MTIAIVDAVIFALMFYYITTHYIKDTLHTNDCHATHNSTTPIPLTTSNMHAIKRTTTNISAHFKNIYAYHLIVDAFSVI